MVFVSALARIQTVERKWTATSPACPYPLPLLPPDHNQRKDWLTPKVPSSKTDPTCNRSPLLLEKASVSTNRSRFAQETKNTSVCRQAPRWSYFVFPSGGISSPWARGVAHFLSPIQLFGSSHRILLQPAGSGARWATSERRSFPTPSGFGRGGRPQLTQNPLRAPT